VLVSRETRIEEIPFLVKSRGLDTASPDDESQFYQAAIAVRAFRLLT
jgi:hypothetical protein